MVARNGKYRYPTYQSWSDMLKRCTNEKNRSYHNYGGRGIKVCERWMSFQNFLNDMGEKPAGMSLDRIDNDGDYEPSNCRWSTRQQQQRNTRRTVYVEGKCALEWAGELGISQSAIFHLARRKGITPHEAINTLRVNK